jgi:glycosyltransferase involved in cell wall biosynthesis
MSNHGNHSADQTPMVTVAMSVLNGGTLLESAVLSVLEQSWLNWELLLLDDGSTDGAIERLPMLNDPRIKVIRDGYNRGLSARLNQAAAMAKGKYFARMDHDDISHPDRFARQVAFLEGYPNIDLLATQCVTMDEQGRLVGVLPSAISHADICRRPWLGFYMAHPSWMGKTAWFQRNPYLDPAPYCCEDQELLLRAHYSSCYHTHHEPLLAYRLRTHTPWKKQLRTRVAMGEMQFHHFFAKGNWVSALLCKFIELTRICQDGLKQICPWLTAITNGNRKLMLPHEGRQEWEVLIGMLKTKVVQSKSQENNASS